MVPMAQAGGRLFSRLRGELALALLRTFVARGIAAVGSFVLVIVLGRLYGAAGVGIFAIAQSVILGAAILARYGMDSALIRFVGSNHQSPAVMTYLRWACTKALLLSLVVAALIFISRDLLEHALNAEGLSQVLISIAIATPAFTLSFLIAGFMKGVRKPATACLLENGSISLVASLSLFALHWLRPGMGISNAGLAYALAAWLVLVQGAWHLWRWHGRRDVIGERGCSCASSKKEFASSSQAFFVMSLAMFMQSVLGLLIAGYFLSSTELGLFRSAQQTAVLISFVLTVINAIFPARFATLFYSGEIQVLSRLVRQGALLGMAMSLPLLIICLLAPQTFLSLFGSGFSGAAGLLRIIAIAQFINVATGSVGFLLNMTGHEKLMSNIAVFSNVLGLLFFFVLIALFGATGAAAALSLVIVLQNLIATLFVWRRLGIWTLPTPNFLRIVGVPSSAKYASSSH